MEKQYSLVEFTKEEAKAFADDMDTVIEKHSAFFKPIPKFVCESPDKPFSVTSELFAMKKVEIKAEESVPSPYENGNDPEKTEGSAPEVN